MVSVPAPGLLLEGAPKRLTVADTEATQDAGGDSALTLVAYLLAFKASKSF